MVSWKDYKLILNGDGRVIGAYDRHGDRLSVYIRGKRVRGDRNNYPTYWNCSGDYTRKEAYNRFNSGRLIFK